ncbi:MAG: hypothetical protein KF819_36335 [Labilithrix sp.]|nr:hypothetical protein [Labilithrix sp.]
MRRWLRVANGLALAAASMLAGCTFLIDFVDVPPPEDAGADAATLPAEEGGPIDAGVDSGSDAQNRDAEPAFVNACKSKVDGRYCPGNQIVWPGDNHELITCRDGGVAEVRPCSAGSGCIRMRNGSPDQCDECPGKPAGIYCGRDMPGWAAQNANLRVRCQNGAQIELFLCPNGCTSNGAASSCK